MWLKYGGLLLDLIFLENAVLSWYEPFKNPYWIQKIVSIQNSKNKTDILKYSVLRMAEFDCSVKCERNTFLIFVWDERRWCKMNIFVSKKELRIFCIVLTWSFTGYSSTLKDKWFSFSQPMTHTIVPFFVLKHFSSVHNDISG